MYAKAYASAALVAATLLASKAGHAQNAAAIERVMVEVSLQTRRLDTALANLGELGEALHGADAGSIGEITSAGRQFTGAVGEAAPVSLILRHMKYPEDVRFTRAMLAISASKAVLAANADTEIINRNLPQITAPGAAAESAKIRDAILETRNLLEKFAQTAD